MSSTVISSPLGNLRITAIDNKVRALQFTLAPESPDSDKFLSGVVIELHEYFEGRRRDFSFPLAPEGTPFQGTVWQALMKIPYGETISYQELARRLGDPGAIRAAAAANGKNPIAIVIPCHRVIGSDGSLTGYAGGLERKKALLRLEKADVMSQMDLFL